MADLIDRPMAYNVLTDYYHHNTDVQHIALTDALSKVPSVEAEPVVKCKDCKYQDKGENESESWNVCNYRPWLYFNINDDDYCSNGERKDR